MTTSERDIIITDCIKQIMGSNSSISTVAQIKDELKKLGVKGVGSVQMVRCMCATGIEKCINMVGMKNNARSKDEGGRDVPGNSSSKKSTAYKRPKGSDKIYKNLLKYGWAQDLDKKYGIYGFAIDDTYIYIGQSVNLLRRLADHEYWMINGECGESPNDQLYTLLREALKKKRKVSFVIIVRFGADINYESKKATLDMYEAQIIQSKLPIANKAIPNAYGHIEYVQILHVGEDNIEQFFTPGFIERRDFLDIDLRKTYGCIFNPYYDEKLKNKLYVYKYDLSEKDDTLDEASPS